MANNDDRIDEEEDDAPEYEDGESEAGVFRWMSVVVVLLAIAGFFGLAWYAYKSGGEVVDEKDAELIQADTAPVKEAPANPGGMPIPNQDKTVYGLVGGKPQNGKVVEHILASPETPVVRNEEADTGTWMSDQVKEKLKSVEAEKTAEPVASAVNPAPVAEEVKPAAPEVTTPPKVEKIMSTSAPEDAVKKAEPFLPAKAREAVKSVGEVQSAAPSASGNAADTATLKTADRAKTPEAPKPAEAVKPADVAAAPKAEEKPVAPPKPELKEAKAPEASSADAEDEAPAAKPEAKKTSQDSKTSQDGKTASTTPPEGARAQLGAFKSQAEAETQWKKIAKKFASDVKGKDHYIVRADLGAKGVFYRLQVAPFGSSPEVEKFCVSLVSDGQGCFPAKGK